MMLNKSRSITNIGVAHFVTITYNNEDLNYYCDLFSYMLSSIYHVFFIEISTFSGSPKKSLQCASVRVASMPHASLSI